MFPGTFTPCHRAQHPITPDASPQWSVSPIEMSDLSHMPSATGSSPSLTRLGTSRLPIPGIPKPLLSLRDPVVRTMPHGGVRHPRSAVGVARPVGVSRVDWPRKSPPAAPTARARETTCHPARRRNRDRQLVQRPPPARPRGARGGSQATGHVHRLHRHPRAHALRVGDHRQRGGRGARRLLQPHRRRPAPDGSAEVHDNAAASRSTRSPGAGLSGVEVVFTKLHAGGKFGGGSASPPADCTVWAPRSSTRCPRGSTSRWTVRRPPRRCRSSGARRGSSPRTGPDIRLHAPVRPAQGWSRQEGRHRHPHPVLARPADLHQGRHVHLRRTRHPGAPTSFIVPGLKLVIRDLRAQASRRASATTAASPSSASSSPPTSR